MKYKLVVILLVFYSEFLLAQKKEYEFDTELCSCKGYYNSKKYTENQLRNTYKILYNSQYIQTSPTARTLEKMDELNVEDLYNECEIKLQELNNLEFIENEFWEKVKNERIKEIESTCELRKYTILALKNPDTLKMIKNVDSTCVFYRNALIEGGEKMLNAWKFLNEKMKEKNINPDRIQREFDNKYNSNNKYEYARIEILTFGWWNNANHLIFHSDNLNDYETEFKKLFYTVKCVCDEP